MVPIYRRAAAAFAVLTLALSAAAAEPVVNVCVFLSPGCPTCRVFEKNALVRLGGKYGCDVRPRYFDVDKIDNYRILVALEARLEDSDNEFPVAVIGESILGGVEEIESSLEGIIEEAARRGGAGEIELPGEDEIAEALALPAVSSEINGVFFDSPGCRSCARAWRVVENFCRAASAGESGKAFSVRRVAGEGREDTFFAEVLAERANLPDDKRLVTPALFVGSRMLVGDEITEESVRGLLAEYSSGAPAPAEPAEEEFAAAAERIDARFREIGFLTALAGGFIDGINPCAFATLVFLVGYLAGTGRRGGDVLIIGATFAAAVFLTYYAIGVGLAASIEGLSLWPLASRVLNWALIAGTLVLAGLSIRDAVRARRGSAGEMTLKLPGFLRTKMRLLVSREFRTRSVALAAFVSGVAISLLEVVCTGQVYLPTIKAMVTLAASRGRTFTLLGVYNLAFVVPLGVVFVAAYCGLSSEKLTGFFQRRIVAGKLLMAAFFVAMAALLFFRG
jgi:hypothetical protein